MNLLENTNRVTLELSNLCNFAARHKGLCPAGSTEGTRILPMQTIREIVSDLKQMGWGENRWLAFHVYNEPLLDPRLFSIIEHVVKELPGVCPYLMTNGWYLTKGLALELMGVGIYRMTVTAYSPEERKRLQGIIRDIPQIRMHIGRLKTTILDPKDGPPTYKPCFAPLCDLVIRSSGNVGLCCLDWAETVTFGNVFENSLVSILKREEETMGNLQRELMLNSRHHEVCRKCWKRRKGTTPDKGRHWMKAKGLDDGQ